MARGDLGRWPLGALADADGTLFAAKAPQKPRLRRRIASRERSMAGWTAPTTIKPVRRRLGIPVRKDASVETDSTVVLQTGDQVEFTTTGEVWSGVFGTLSNGPNGWDRLEYSPTFPLHGDPDGHPFALVGRLLGYFFIGDGARFGLREWLGPPTALYLTVNDDTWRGSGQLTCTITLRR
jgi:hypothetical protein